MAIRWLLKTIAVPRPIFSLYRPARNALFTFLGGIVLSSVLSISGNAAGPEKIEGVLLDKECSSKAETHMVSAPTPHMEGGMLWAYTHTRQCALMCQKSGYGVFTRENKYLVFDAAGNQKAIALLQASKKTEDLEIEVTGTVDGNTIKVATLKFQ